MYLLFPAGLTPHQFASVPRLGKSNLFFAISVTLIASKVWSHLRGSKECVRVPVATNRVIQEVGLQLIAEGSRHCEPRSFVFQQKTRPGPAPRSVRVQRRNFAFHACYLIRKFKYIVNAYKILIGEGFLRLSRGSYLRTGIHLSYV